MNEAVIARAKKDVDLAIKTWKRLLVEFFPSVEYAYAKGSAVKPWHSPIDYVPILSDLDIHAKFSTGLGDSENMSIETSLELASAYREEMEKKSDLHIPRIQLVSIDEIQKLDKYVPPDASSVKPMIGTPSFPPRPDDDTIRSGLCTWIAEAEAANYANSLAPSLWDRSGPDWWIALRRLSWRVSPSGFRVLSQYSYSPWETWKMNRSSVVKELRGIGLSLFADYYEQYYLLCWELFFSGFSDEKLFVACVKKAVDVLKTSASSVPSRY